MRASIFLPIVASLGGASACVPLMGLESDCGDSTQCLNAMAVNATLGDVGYLPGDPPINANAICAKSLETPVAMRLLLALDTAAYSIAAMFDRDGVAVDAFGEEMGRRCLPTTPEEEKLFDLHERVAMTYTYAYTGMTFMPYCFDALDEGMAAADHPLSIITDENADIDSPWGLAKYYVDEVYAYLMENDGWNADGSASRDYNRMPFSDYAITDSKGNSWTPYTPVNSPYEFKNKQRWQPLMESNGLGYISTQEHVTAHIGMTARFYGFYDQETEDEYAGRYLEDPEYDYDEEVAKALEETRLMATDEFKQHAIAVFDNKWTSLIPIKVLFFRRNVAFGIQSTTLEFFRLNLEVQLAIYNSVILAWREKVHHDLPRPPTVVTDKLGDTLVESYGGLGMGVQTLKASEWEPFIRTMPHSEFPSGSSCLCKAYAEQIAYLYGTDTIEPPLDVPGNFTFASWSEVADICGESRLWGGLHFEASVPGGEELCGGYLMAPSLSATMDGLIHGDGVVPIFPRDAGELMVRPLVPGSGAKDSGSDDSSSDSDDSDDSDDSRSGNDDSDDRSSDSDSDDSDDDCDDH